MFRKRENIGNQSDVMFMGEWGRFKQTFFYELSRQIGARAKDCPCVKVETHGRASLLNEPSAM